MKVLGISGSLRRDSHNTKLLRAAAELLPSGAELVLFDELEQVPPYNEDRDTEHPPHGVAGLWRAIADADAVLFSTPEYNSSLPGVLKNAIDWASRPFETNPLRGKPVMVIGASTGLFGAVWAQAELRKVLTHLGANVLGDELPLGTAHEAFTEGGSLLDPGVERRLGVDLDHFIEAAAASSEAVGSAA
ncbi:MAG: NAD(P)H-dependent oxidoreductase [Actinomycetota bacterium]|nr:NAD(P)H-dependent oxidoreductase [Actinomycetota bacterium]